MLFTNKAINKELINVLNDLFFIYDEDLGFICEPFKQLSRHHYESLKKIFDAIGVRWVKGGKYHVAAHDPTRMISEIIQQGCFPEVNPFSLFETPEPAVNDLLNFVSLPVDYIHPDVSGLSPWRILEPSAGRGAIARGILERMPHAQLDCIEIDENNIEILKAQGIPVIQGDFLNWESDRTNRGYHYIVMNPPFNKTEWVRHVLKAHSLLAPGGKLGAIIPRQIPTDKKSLELWNLIGRCGSVEPIDHEFEGTKIKTSILTLDYWSPDLETNYQEKHYGYTNRGVYHLSLMLENEFKFHQFLQTSPSKKALIDQIKYFILSEFPRRYEYHPVDIVEQTAIQFLKELNEYQSENSNSIELNAQLSLI